MPQTAEMVRRELRLPNAVRLAQTGAGSYDAAARTFAMVAATDAPVRMPGWQLGLESDFLEILDMGPTAVDLSQVLAGNCPLLDAHQRWSMDGRLGVVRSGQIEPHQLAVTAQFGRSDGAVAAAADLADGLPQPVSSGYRRQEMIFERFEGDLPVYRTTRWTLTEVSFVPIAADANAGVRAGQDGLHPCVIIMETRAMPQEITAAADVAERSPAPDPTPVVQPAPVAEASEASRAAPAPAPAPVPAPPGAVRFAIGEVLDFVELGRSFGLETEARALANRNDRGEIGVDAARSALLTAAAEKQRAAVAVVPAGAAARAGDQNEASRAAVVDAMVARALGRNPSDAAREFMGMRLLEIAAQRSGCRDRDPDLILRAAHTSSDFPLVLEAAANKVLLDRYQTAAPTFQAIARRRDLRDFKATKLLRIGDFPTLQPYGEDGEIKSGTINEGRETVLLGSYGRILRLTRQAIVNDDLGAFDDVFGSIGTTVAMFENATFFAMKGTIGPVLADGKAVFHTDHGNLASAGTVIDVTNVGKARAAIRKQKNLDGNVLNLTPKFILVGPDKETEADQLVAGVTPAQSDKVNPFSNRLTVVTEGSIAGNPWEVYADPSVAPVWSYGYLADAPGPKVMVQQEFNVDGSSFRVTEDFYANAVDSRGAYRNPGA